MANVSEWARANIESYFDNATARRDFRAQLRGNRSVILWAVYLSVLVGLATFDYSLSVARDNASIISAQQSLQTFYMIVMGVLGGMVLLVAPALAATTLVLERERKSLDLVFSAPVKPKNFLVGKMISAYRYVWMLLALSLPVVAVSVVLGGRTWSDVLAAFALLSFHAMLYSAMALTISAISRRAVSAVIYTYAAIGIYGLITFGIASSAMSASVSPITAPFYTTLSPLLVGMWPSSHTVIGGFAVPNWILFGFYSLFMTRLLLLGAASALSPYNSAETKNLRVTGLVTAGLAAVVAIATYLSVAFDKSDFTGASSVVGNILMMVPLPMLFLLPFLTCSASDGDRKFWPNGFFSFKEAIRGTPAGGLAYMFSIIGVVSAIVIGSAWIKGRVVPDEAIAYSLLWSVGFWVFSWSLGVMASATTKELRSARTLHLAALLTVFGLPVPFLCMIQSDPSQSPWEYYPFYALWSSDPVFPRLATGLSMLAIGLIISFAFGRRVRQKSQTLAAVIAEPSGLEPGFSAVPGWSARTNDLDTV